MVREICLALLLLVAVSSTCSATELAGVNVADTMTTDDGAGLVLNGAGIRKKLFFDIYIAALYLEETMAGPDAILADEGHKRMLMHFLYKEIAPEKLVEAWNEGFEANLDETRLALLQGSIDRFNAMFETVKSGDEVIVDYIPGKGTCVQVKGEVKGVIAGREFNDALLSIWLGDKPVTTKLKSELLGE